MHKATKERSVSCNDGDGKRRPRARSRSDSSDAATELSCGDDSAAELSYGIEEGGGSEVNSPLLRSLMLADLQRRELYDSLITEEVSTTEKAPAALPLKLLWLNSRAVDKEQLRYDVEFQDYLLLGRCYLGCGPVLFKDGFSVWPLHLGPGTIENFLLYIMNNHMIAACIYACKQSSHSRGGRRVVLLTQHSISFFLTSITSVLFASAGIGFVYAQATQQAATSFLFCQLFDLIIAAPIAIGIGRFIERAYRCNVNVHTIEKRPRFVQMLRLVKKIVLVPAIGFACTGLLVVCAILTTGKKKSGFIVDYIIQVFMMSVVLDLLYAMADFVSTHHFAIHFFNGALCLLSVGKLYLELLIKDAKLINVDFEERVVSVLWGFVIVSSVRDKAQVHSASVARRVSFQNVNPMHQIKQSRQSNKLTSVVESREKEREDEGWSAFGVQADAPCATFAAMNPVRFSVTPLLYLC